MVRLCLFLAALCLANAQPENPDQIPPDAGAMMPDTAILMQVQQEEFMARRFLEIVLKLEHSQFNMYGAMSWLQGLSKSMQAEQADAVSLLERGSQTRSLEDETLLTNNEWINGDLDEYADNTAKEDLLFVYNLIRAINIKGYQVIYFAGDLQREFYMDRIMQLRVVGAGGQLPPQLYTLLYLKVFGTYLKTMKLSYALQTISHFRMWLEDAIDVNTAILEGSAIADQVAEEQEPALIRDKMWAFSAYQHFAVLDYSIFFIDLYMEYMLSYVVGGGSMGSMGVPTEQPPAEQPAAAQATSLLEVEETPAEPAQNKFIPFVGYNWNPMMYMKLYKLYYIWFQCMSSQAAYGSVSAQALSFQKKDEDPEAAAQLQDYARMQFASFAQNLLMASYLEMMTAWFEIYGSFMMWNQGRMGSFQAAQPVAEEAPPAAAKSS